MDTRARAHARPRTALLIALLAALLAACAPSTAPGLPDDPATREAERAARIAFHRMQIGFLETGAYTTNVLVDLALPQGVRWTVDDFVLDGSSYRLRFTHDAVPASAWLVSPAGVRRVAGT